MNKIPYPTEVMMTISSKLAEISYELDRLNNEQTESQCRMNEKLKELKQLYAYVGVAIHIQSNTAEKSS